MCIEHYFNSIGSLIIIIYIYIYILFRSEVWLVSEEWKTSKLCAKLGGKRVELTAKVSELRTDFIKLILQKNMFHDTN